MPVTLNVSSTVKREISFMNRLRAGFQKAQKESLNDTGFELKRDLVKSLSTDLDRPTPFTKRGISIQKATLSTMKVDVFVLPKQEEYLIRQVFPQQRKAFSQYIIIPTNGTRRNQYGNLTKAARKKLFDKNLNNIFEKNGKVFVYSKRTRKLVALLVKETRYTIKRWKMYEHAEKSATRNFPYYLNRRLSALERKLV